MAEIHICLKGAGSLAGFLSLFELFRNGGDGNALFAFIASDLAELFGNDSLEAVYKLNKRVIHVEVGVRPEALGEVVVKLSAAVKGGVVRLVKIFLAVYKELFVLPMHVVVEGVVAVCLICLFYETLDSRFKRDDFKILVKLVRLDIDRNLSRGLVFNVQNVAAEIFRGGNYTSRRGEQRVHRSYRKHVHYQEKRNASQNIHQQEDSAENRFYSVVHFAAEKAEKSYHSRGDKQRPVAPVQQERGEKHHHVYHAYDTRYKRTSRIKEQQSGNQRKSRIYYREHSFVRVDDVVEKHGVGKIYQTNGICRAEYAYRKNKPFVGKYLFYFFHSDDNAPAGSISPFAYVHIL